MQKRDLIYRKENCKRDVSTLLQTYLLVDTYDCGTSCLLHRRVQ